MELHPSSFLRVRSSQPAPEDPRNARKINTAALATLSYRMSSLAAGLSPFGQKRTHSVDDTYVLG